MDRPVNPLALLSALAILAFAPPTTAAPARFSLDESQSRITISGNIMGLPLREQGPGSMSTTFGGTVVADVSDSSIQFTGGSVLEARTNGDWRPGVGGESGSAPANFAAEASTLLGTVRGALRNLVLDLTSAALPITGGQFDASNLVFAFPVGSKAAFDYNAGLLGSDSVVLSGLSTNKIVNGATVSGAAGSRKLTIQVDTEFVFELLSEGDSVVKLVGALVAVEAVQDQPTIRSIEVKDGTVILRVEGAGAEPRLDGSGDLRQWTTQNPSRSVDGNAVVLTLPATAVQQFYRVAK
ncbi:MAG: hypothetical protein AB9869_26225 [Verrucomicrobiia bacterium]